MHLVPVDPVDSGSRGSRGSRGSCRSWRSNTRRTRPHARRTRDLAAILALVLVSGLTIVLGGCMGPTFVVQQYAGPVRSRETIATLRINGKDPVRLAALDDDDLGGPPVVEDGRLHIELLPGRHVVTVYNASDPKEPRGSVAFKAEANKVYRVTYVAGAPRIFEVDRGGDTPGADVTLP